MKKPDMKIEINHQGRDFDELLAENVEVVHIERMSKNHIFIGLYTKNQNITINLTSSKKIYINQ